MRSSAVDVLLVSPRRQAGRAPFGDVHLVCLGSAMEAWTGARVQILNLDYEQLLPDPRSALVFDRRNDVVGISCFSSFDFLRAYRLGLDVKRRHPSVCLVVGGYHPSARPDDFLGEGSPFDHVVVGDGERALQRIVEAVAAGDRLEERIVRGAPLARLDDLPELNWSLIDRYRPIASQVSSQVSMFLSRGCVYRCVFCMEAAKSGQTWSAFSPERAELELRRLDDWIDLSGRNLFLCDPLFGVDRGWRREVLERIAHLALPVNTIWGLVRADLLDEVDVELCRRAGFGFGFGLESGDPAMLEIIHKGGPGPRYLERIAALASHAGALGVPWGANVIAGHPGETPESLERSARWLARLFGKIEPLTGHLSVDPFRFYPGSLIDKNLNHYEERYGTRIHQPDWWKREGGEFTSMWVDPSSTLPFRERERRTAELFLPILRDVARRFSYTGRASDYYQHAIPNQLELFGRRQRVATIRHLLHWEANKLDAEGGRARDCRLDPGIADLLRREREQTVDGIAARFGAIAGPLRRALIDVPRERFVAEAHLWSSTEDRSLPLLPGGASTLSAIHAYATNYRLLELGGGDHLLELGGGSGYGAAVAARLVGPKGRVRTVEIVQSLARLAERNLADLEQVEVTGDEQPLAEHLGAGFEKVLFCFAIDELPTGLDQLPVGGRLLAPVRTAAGEQVLTLVVRGPRGVVTSEHGPVRYVADRGGPAGPYAADPDAVSRNQARAET